MKKIAGALGVILAAVFLYMAINTHIPGKYIASWGSNAMREYVGGDAYNFIIEASLRGGEIAGAQITKAIYYSVSALLFILSLPCFFPVTDFGTLVAPLQEKIINVKKSVDIVSQKASELVEIENKKITFETEE